MKYKELQHFLSTLTEEQLEMDVSIGITKDMISSSRNNDDVEFFDYVLSGIENVEDGTLDVNHPYLIVEIS